MLWLVGDRLLTEERWRALVGAADLIRLDGRRLDLAALGREVDTLPMFADRKWILVQEFRLPGKKGDGGDTSRSGPDGEKELYAILERVKEPVTVILVSELGDKRTRIAKLVQTRGEYIELPGFKEYETGKLVEWVTGRLRSRGKRIPPAIAADFVECVGPDLALLASEVDKITVAMGEEEVVSDAHMAVVAGSPVVLRRLIDEGIARKNPGRAEELLREALSANEHPLRILNFLIPRVRDLLKARLCPEGRRNTDRAAEVFGPMHPFRLRSLYEEADRFSAGELRAALHSLVLADTCLKSSVDGAHVMSLLVAALTGAVDHESFARAVQSYVEPWD